jgi:hypothetical protein
MKQARSHIGMSACLQSFQGRSHRADLLSLYEPGRRDRKGMGRAGRYRPVASQLRQARPATRLSSLEAWYQLAAELPARLWPACPLSTSRSRNASPASSTSSMTSADNSENTIPTSSIASIMTNRDAPSLQATTESAAEPGIRCISATPFGGFKKCLYSRFGAKLVGVPMRGQERT